MNPTYQLYTIFALVGSALMATLGWYITARQARRLSRKQHTINLIVQANFDDGFLTDRNDLAPVIRDGGVTLALLLSEKLEKQMQRVLNHHEFVAAAVRSGDIDEDLLRDSEGMLYIQIFSGCRPYIAELRETYARDTLFEHLEWLYARWHLDPPSKFQRWIERTLERPTHPNTARLKELQHGFNPKP